MKLCFGSSKRVSGIFEEVNSQAVSGHKLVEWRVLVLMEDYSRSLPLLPDISRLYWQFGQENMWDCCVIAALVFLYLEVEGPDTRGTIVRSITIDHSGHEGVIRYARDLDRTGDEEKKLMGWWAQGARP
jgi:hypothetical protein